MRMTSSIQCIIVLACCITYTSMAILKCQCVKRSKSLNASLIAGVKEYPPRPYCNQQEVIAILKDKRLQCLDPSSKFTQAVLQTIKMQRAFHAHKRIITSPKTTTSSATESATVSPTATPTSS
ncbi:growth-regulated alpha protein-like [Etheostoma cragini]|uniref:growth-regulated alpha protein-like n=1 Tax=Etheostoma cragini TaxID=417921 RepID=UPI00155E3475|nr:growth-regulated alpha protein-like [Etheostoma cragini]